MQFASLSSGIIWWALFLVCIAALRLPLRIVGTNVPIILAECQSAPEFAATLHTMAEAC
jgi:hypothetical protein